MFFFLVNRVERGTFQEKKNAAFEVKWLLLSFLFFELLRTNH